jgi:hypothetical protein
MTKGEMIAKLQELSRRLEGLVKEPHFGSVMWDVAVGRTLDEIAAFAATTPIQSLSVTDVVEWLRSPECMDHYDGLAECTYEQAVFPWDLADAIAAGHCARDLEALRRSQTPV